MPDPYHAFLIAAADWDQEKGSAIAIIVRTSGDGPPLEQSTFIARPGSALDAAAKAREALEALHAGLKTLYIPARGAP
jgi:hypothetical protein